MDTKRIFTSLCFVFASACMLSQGNKYFITFKNKTGTPYSVSKPTEFLTQASVDRRARYNIGYTSDDLPVNPDYINQVKAIPHTRVHYASKWMNGVVVSFDSFSDEGPALAQIHALPFVEGGSRVRRYRHISVPPDSSQGNKIRAIEATAAYEYGGSAVQVRQLNLACLHDKGYRGQGVVIGVLDAGFFGMPQNNVFDSLFQSGRLLGTRDFVNGGTDVFQGGEHGSMVMSCMAALKHGVAIGTAPLSSYWLFRTEEGGAETISEEYNWIRGAEFADSVGCDILTTSLGYTDFNDPTQNHTRETLNGRTAPMSIASTIAARKGMFVLNAAGNEGNSEWRYISVPGDADSICTVGSVTADGIVSSFSSVGPTVDGRIKPDLVARGEGAWVCTGDAICYPGNGTSFATPVLAGAVACYWQANRKIDNIRLLNRLRNNASNKNSPDNSRGWGIPNVCADMSGSFDFSAYSKPSGLVVQVQDIDYEFVNVQVYDLLGKLITKVESPGNELSVDFLLPDLSAGVYVIRVETSSGKKSKKILRLDL